MLEQGLDSREEAEQVSGDVAFVGAAGVATFRPPPLNLVLVALPGDGQLVAGPEAQLVVVALLVVVDGVDVAAVNNAKFFLQ